MATLTYCDVDGADKTVELGPVPLTVGRNPDCSIRSDDPRLSRQHARFILHEGNVWVEDLGSANGVWVGMQRVGSSPVPWGEVVVIGSLIFRAVNPMMTSQAQAGTHALLAEWLVNERKSRGAGGGGDGGEREMLAKRVGESFQELTRFKEEAAAVERRAQAAEARVAAVEAQAAEAEQRAGAAERELSTMERRVREAEEHASSAQKAAQAAASRSGSSEAARLVELEGEIGRLRKRLTETDAELDELDRLRTEIKKRPAVAAPQPAPVASVGLPHGMGEQIASLSDSVSSLRASMRAISDETAVMDQTDSVQVVTAAASSAMEEIERARETLRNLTRFTGG